MDYAKVFSELGFESDYVSGNQAVGMCPYCQKEKKFYLNLETGQWDCKSGACAKSGNLYSMMEEYWEKCRTNDYYMYPDVWERLGTDRGIGVHTLWDAGIAYDFANRRFAIPVYNAASHIVNFRFYSFGRKLMGLPEIEIQLYGFENLGTCSQVYICEGEWDTIALNALLPENSVAVGVPGAAVFKDAWVQHFKGKVVTVCYDHDVDGEKGCARVVSKLEYTVSAVWTLKWPDEYPKGYDIRDFYGDGGTFAELQTWFKLVTSGGRSGQGAASKGSSTPVDGPDTFRDTPFGEKPAFEEVLACYGKWLEMTPDYEMALRVSYAVVLSQSIPGDPLWVYLVGPPSSGKTVILQSLSDVEGCVLRSTMTVNSLVSGFRGQDGADPSLIPHLDGKTFVFKDWTEVLNMDRAARDQIYAILRGAYDGLVEKSFGNGVTRRYTAKFSMLSGVTQAVFAERSANMGERFLFLHILKGNDLDMESMILRALGNVGHEAEMQEVLNTLAKRYLEPTVPEDVIAEAEASIDSEFTERILALCQLVAQLRGQVQRDYKDDILLYRPQIEIGARLAKQLKKLALSLALLETPIGITERVYAIVRQIAFDTCIGYNLDIVQTLYYGGKMTHTQLIDLCGIPLTTIRRRLEDMDALGIVVKSKGPNPAGVGASADYYDLAERTRRNWERAEAHGIWFNTSANVKYRKR